MASTVEVLQAAFQSPWAALPAALAVTVLPEGPLWTVQEEFGGITRTFPSHSTSQINVSFTFEQKYAKVPPVL